MIKKKNVVLFLLMCITVFLSVNLVQADDIYRPQFRMKRDIGREEDIQGQVSVLYPIRQNHESLFYSDLRGVIKEESTEMNLGLAYRKLIDKEIILGAYLFGDRREEYNEYWNQLTIGTEFLTEQYSLSINGYFPEDKKVLLSTIADDDILVDGNNISYEEAELDKYISAMKGYDIEIGAEIPGLPFNLTGYYKYFSFSGDNMEDLHGNNIRLETSIETDESFTWTIGLDWQDDNSRGNRILGTIAFQVPMGSTAAELRENDLSTTEKKMTGFTQRDVDVVVNNTATVRRVKAVKPAVDPVNNKEVGDIWFATADGNGDGTEDNPTSLNKLTELGAGENDIIVVLGNQGDIDTGTTGFQLENGQKLLSPGGHLLLSSVDNDRPLVYRPEGEQGTLTNDLETDILLLNDNTTVSGIRFKNGRSSIIGKGISGDININNNTIVNAAGDGLLINGSELSDVVVKDNQVESAARIGIGVINDSLSVNANSDIVEDTINIEISGNKIGEAFGEAAIGVASISNYPTNINISDNQIDNAVSAGIISHLIEESPGHNSIDSIDIQKNAVQNNITVADNNINKAGWHGMIVDIDTDSLTNNIDIINNNINKAGDYGMVVDIYTDIESAANNIDIINNNVKQAGSSGMLVKERLYSGSTNMEISNNQIEDVAENGIEINTIVKGYGDDIDPQYNLTLANNIINKAGISGLDINAEIDSVTSKMDIINNQIDLAEVNGIDLSIHKSTFLTERLLDVTLDENIINKSETGVMIAGKIESGSNNIELINNQIIDAATGGIMVDLIEELLSNELYPDINVTAADNFIDRAGEYGVAVEVHGPQERVFPPEKISGTSNVIITDNVINNIIRTITNNPKGGIYVENYAENGKVVITDNQIEKSSIGGINLYADVDKVDIAGNQLKDINFAGIRVYTFSEILNINNNGIEKSNYYGVWLQAANGSIVDAVVESNNIQSTEYDGLFFCANGGDNEEDSVINAAVNDNIFGDGVGGDDIGVYAGGTVNFDGNQAP